VSKSAWKVNFCQAEQKSWNGGEGWDRGGFICGAPTLGTGVANPLTFFTCDRLGEREDGLKQLHPSPPCPPNIAQQSVVSGGTRAVRRHNGFRSRVWQLVPASSTNAPKALGQSCMPASREWSDGICSRGGLMAAFDRHWLTTKWSSVGRQNVP